MIQNLIDVIVFALFSSSAWYFFYYVVPVAGTQLALYMLHNRRDTIYAIVEDSELGEKSLIYQDMLWGITALIHLLREEPRGLSVSASLRILAKTPQNPEKDWRDKRYEREMNTLFSDRQKKEELNAAIGAFRDKDSALLLFVLLSHPLILLIAVFASITSLLLLPGYLLYRIYSQSDVSMIGKTIDSLRKSESSESQPFKFQLNP